MLSRGVYVTKGNSTKLAGSWYDPCSRFLQFEDKSVGVTHILTLRHIEALSSFVLVPVVVPAGQLPVGGLQPIYKGEMNLSHHTTELWMKRGCQ